MPGDYMSMPDILHLEFTSIGADWRTSCTRYFKNPYTEEEFYILRYVGLPLKPLTYTVIPSRHSKTPLKEFSDYTEAYTTLVALVTSP